MQEPIQIDTSQAALPDPIKVDAGDAPISLPPDVIDRRTDKITFSTGLTADDVRPFLATGKENELRQSESAKRKGESVQQFMNEWGARAAAKGGPLTSDEISQMEQDYKARLAFDDPHAVFEHALTEKYFKTLYKPTQGQTNWYDQLLASQPETVQDVSSVGASYAAKEQYIQNKKENIEAKYNQQTWPSYLVDLGKDLATFGLHDEYKLRGNVPGVSKFNLAATNMEEQRKALMRMPNEEAYKLIDQITDNMDPRTALTWLEHIQGNVDVGLGDAFSLLTLATVPGMGLAGKGAINLLSGVKATTKNVVKTMGANETPRVLAPAAVGDVETAATMKAGENLVKELDGRYNPATQAVEGLPSALNVQVEAMKRNPGNFRELVNRIEQHVDTMKTQLIEMFTHNARVNEIPAITATAEGMRDIQRVIRGKYRNLDSNISDIDIYWSPTGNHFAEMKLRQADMNNFGSTEQAGAWAFAHGITLKGSDKMERQLYLQGQIELATRELVDIREPFTGVKIPPGRVEELESNIAKYSDELSKLRMSNGATIERDGKGFYISYWAPVPYTDDIIRAGLFRTAESQTPKGYIGNILSWIRTPEETLSTDARMNSKLAVYAPANFIKLIKEDLKEYNQYKWAIPGTSKYQEWKKLEQAMRHGETMPNPEKPGSYGYTFQSPGEMEEYYLTQGWGMPSERAVGAYFAWKRMVAMTESFENIKRFASDLRVGTETHQLVAVGEKGTRVYSNKFDGMLSPTVPGGDRLIAIIGHTPETTRVVMAKNLKKEDREKLAQWKIVELRHPEEFPLRGFGPIKDNYIEFVANDKMISEPLAFKAPKGLDTAPFVQETRMKIVQPIVRWDDMLKKHVYMGDRTFTNVDNAGVGNAVLKQLNEVRGHLERGDEAAAQAAGQHLPPNWRDTRGMYEGEGAYRKDVPFYLVPSHKSVVDMDRNLQNRFTNAKGKVAFRDISRDIIKGNERTVDDLFTVKDVGTKENPTYKLERTPTLDPIPSLNRSMRKIINSTYMEPLKNYMVEHWTQEALMHEAINATRAQVQNAPEYYFYHGELKSGTPIEIRNRLEGNRFKARQIMGLPSKTQATLHSIEDWVTKGIYERFGPTRLDPSWVIPKTTQVAGAVRSIVYNSVMGMFALPQFLVQNMTYASIIGIAGARGLQGSFGGLLHQMQRMNPAIMDHLDATAAKLGLFKRGELTEARDNMLKTGFHLVGAEHAGSSMPFSTNVINSAGHDILELGSALVRAADRNIRFAAWYSAHSEFRAANPTTKIGNAELGKIFERAEMLSGNMSNASKSLLQQGPLAFTTQFLSFNMRLAEMLTGHRLTRMEKARLFGTYWGLFGVSALGLSGYPFGDTLRSYLINNGYHVGENAVNDLLVNGAPAAALAMITGNYYNFGSRMGSTGFDIIRDAWDSDKPLLELAGGATYSTLKSAWELSDGFRTAMGSLLRDEDKHFPLKMADLIDMTKTFASGNMAVRAMVAANTGDWISRKGQVIDTGVPLWDTLFMSATGMQHQNWADLRNLYMGSEDRKDMLKTVETQFIKEYRRFTDSMKNNDPQQATEYGKRMRALLINYPVQRKAELLARAIKTVGQPLVQSANYNYFLGRDVPEDQREAMRKSYIRQQELNQGKK